MPSPQSPASPQPTLDTLGVGRAARLSALEAAPDEASLLRAMGLAEGQTVSLLRVGPGGDPLHVRLGNGGEFALARPLARAVRIEPQP